MVSERLFGRRAAFIARAAMNARTIRARTELMAG